MPKVRLRFTVRRLMLVIVIAAFLLAVFIQVRNRQRRQVLIDELRREIRRNDLAEAHARARAEAARRQGDPSGDVQDDEHTQVLLQEEGQALRARLTRLQR